MRDFINSKVSLSAIVLAGVVLAGGVVSLAQDVILCQIGEPCHCGFTNPCFKPQGPVFLDYFGCKDPSDRDYRQSLREACDEIAESAGFQAGVVQQYSRDPRLNFTEICVDQERPMICVGVGGGACTIGPTNCTFID